MLRKFAETFRQRPDWYKEGAVGQDPQDATTDTSTIEYGKNYKTVSHRLRRSYPSLEGNQTLKSDSKIYIASKLQESQRVLILDHIPKTASHKHLLDKVGGGPLERVVIYYKDHRHGTAITSCELHFIFAKDARDFYRFATTPNGFNVLGGNVKVQWASETNSDLVGAIHPRMPKYLQHEIVAWGARRCLIFTKLPHSSTKSSTDQIDRQQQYPNAARQYCNSIHVAAIRKELASFGEVMDILPVVSRKTCFAVIFADVRSAVVAKKTCETPGSPLNTMFRGWLFWYGKDPTDHACAQS